MTMSMQVIIFITTFLGCLGIGIIISTYEKKG